MPVYAPHEIFAELGGSNLLATGDREMLLEQFWQHNSHKEFVQAHPGNNSPHLWKQTLPYILYGDGGEVYDGEKYWIISMKSFLGLGPSLDTYHLMAVISNRAVIPEVLWEPKR